eukprot:10876464-Prorocentrum_lima.AAC.1
MEKGLYSMMLRNGVTRFLQPQHFLCKWSPFFPSNILTAFSMQSSGCSLKSPRQCFHNHRSQ